MDDATADVGAFAGGWSLTIQTQTPVCSSCTTSCTPGVINPLVTVSTNIGAPFGLQGSSTCATDGYSNDFLIQSTLTNLSTSTLTNLAFQVVELQHANGPVPSIPFRLTSADGATCTSGGLVGATQSLTGVTLAPGQSATVTFRIAMPSVRRFRFFVNVLGCITGSTRLPEQRLDALAKASPIEIKTGGLGRSGATEASRRRPASGRHSAGQAGRR
ncbi:MAG: hypothetical protein NZ585_01320 [Chloracidobacterium sp.]|nr:hypothetical protein [Chloracidobacterium sp.]